MTPKKEFNLKEEREKIIERILELFKYDFGESFSSVKQIHDKTDLLDSILRIVKEQDQEFIRRLKESKKQPIQYEYCLDAFLLTEIEQFLIRNNLCLIDFREIDKLSGFKE